MKANQTKSQLVIDTLALHQIEARPLLLAALLLITTTELKTHAIPVLNPENGNYYEAVVGNYSWPDARDAAAAQSYLGFQGHLATITSASENSFIFGAVYLWNFRYDAWVWLGGFQPPGSPEPAGGWSWVTGEPFSYANWDLGQPSDSGGPNSPNPQNFLLMWNQGFWNDASGPGFGGISVSGYIIEYEAIPEPSILSLIGMSVIAFGILNRREAI